MSQRESGYVRKERDLYETPEWVTEALLPHLPQPSTTIWEPACGSGKMVRVLEAAGHQVIASDISLGCDFLETNDRHVDWIVTNPPYAAAKEFIQHAMTHADQIAMLLRTDYDHAKTRQHLFGTDSGFAKKVVLTRRIIWFDGPNAAPSFNHAWYIWKLNHDGPATLAYGP